MARSSPPVVPRPATGSRPSPDHGGRSRSRRRHSTSRRSSIPSFARYCLSLLAVTAAGPLTVEALPAMRAVVPPFLPKAAAEPDWSWRTIPGDRPARPMSEFIVIDPEPGAVARRPAILHFHGGGFMAGSAEASLWSTQVASARGRRAGRIGRIPARAGDQFSRRAGGQLCRARLAVMARPTNSWSTRRRIAVAGESAGGGHAAMLALAARDRGEFAIAGQALVYPMLDDRTGSTMRVECRRMSARCCGTSSATGSVGRR